MNFENRKNSEKEKEIQKNKEKKNDSILKRNQNNLKDLIAPAGIDATNTNVLFQNF